jgi:hypothetical protein
MAATKGGALRARHMKQTHHCPQLLDRNCLHRQKLRFKSRSSAWRERKFQAATLAKLGVAFVCGALIGGAGDPI